MKKRLVFKNNHQRVFNLVTAGKFLALAVIFVFAILPAIALAQFGLEYGTLTGLGSEDLRVTIMKIVRIVLGLVGIIAIIIIYALNNFLNIAGGFISFSSFIKSAFIFSLFKKILCFA